LQLKLNLKLSTKLETVNKIYNKSGWEDSEKVELLGWNRGSEWEKSRDRGLSLANARPGCVCGLLAIKMTMATVDDVYTATQMIV